MGGRVDVPPHPHLNQISTIPFPKIPRDKIMSQNLIHTSFNPFFSYIKNLVCFSERLILVSSSAKTAGAPRAMFSCRSLAQHTCVLWRYCLDWNFWDQSGECCPLAAVKTVPKVHVGWTWKLLGRWSNSRKIVCNWSCMMMFFFFFKGIVRLRGILRDCTSKLTHEATQPFQWSTAPWGWQRGHCQPQRSLQWFLRRVHRGALRKQHLGWITQQLTNETSGKGRWCLNFIKFGDLTCWYTVLLLIVLLEVRSWTASKLYL